MDVAHSTAGARDRSLRDLVTFVGPDRALLAGPAGALPVSLRDELTLKLAMLYEGQCGGLGVTKAAAKYGYTRQGYYKLLHRFRQHGAQGLLPRRRGPYAPQRRQQLIRAVVSQRFQHPDATAADIARHLQEDGLRLSTRSVERIISQFGLQRHAYPKNRAPARRPSSPMGSLEPARPADSGKAYQT